MTWLSLPAMLDEFVALDCVSAVSQAASSGSVTSSTWSDERRYGGQLTELLLHEELLDFWSAFQPTEAELSTRRLLVERVTALSKMVWPHSILHPFGSYSTGIQLPTSDIDLVVVGTGHVHKSTQPRALQQLADALQTVEWKVTHLEATLRT